MCISYSYYYSCFFWSSSYTSKQEKRKLISRQLLQKSSYQSLTHSLLVWLSLIFAEDLNLYQLLPLQFCNKIQNLSNSTKNLAWIVGLDTEFLALVGCIEFIVVTQAATVDELLTLLRLIIVEISIRSSVTSTDRPWQITAICSKKQLP